MIQIEGGPRFAQAQGDPVLRAALRASVGFPYECNSGSCGLCRFELLEGTVEVAWKEAPAWSDRDRRKGRYLGCQTAATTDCSIRVKVALPEPGVVPPVLHDAELISVRPLTHDMNSLTFRTAAAATFLPGQYAVVSIPGVTGARCYSMANLPNSEGLWEFIVRRVPEGRESGRFVEAKPATRFTIDGPYGHAYFREDDPADIVCIAGGSGLAPMLSIARAARRSDHRVHFFYGGRRPHDMECIAEVESLPDLGRGIHIYPAISAPMPGEDDWWTGDREMLPSLVERKMGADLAAYRFYAAGSPPLMSAIEDLLVSRSGVSSDRVHFDRFV